MKINLTSRFIINPMFRYKYKYLADDIERLLIEENKDMQEAITIALYEAELARGNVWQDTKRFYFDLHLLKPGQGRKAFVVNGKAAEMAIPWEKYFSQPRNIRFVLQMVYTVNTIN